MVVSASGIERVVVIIVDELSSLTNGADISNVLLIHMFPPYEDIVYDVERIRVGQAMRCRRGITLHKQRIVNEVLR
jgi:hypothetical protein